MAVAVANVFQCSSSLIRSITSSSLSDFLPNAQVEGEQKILEGRDTTFTLNI